MLERDAWACRSRGGLLLQADVCRVEPADDRLEPEELRIGDERERDVLLGGLGLDLRIALHYLDRVPPVHLEDLVDVDAGDLQGYNHLDHELIAWRWHELGRRSKPIGELIGAA